MVQQRAIERSNWPLGCFYLVAGNIGIQMNRNSLERGCKKLFMEALKWTAENLQRRFLKAGFSLIKDKAKICAYSSIHRCTYHLSWTWTEHPRRRSGGSSSAMWCTIHWSNQKYARVHSSARVSEFVCWTPVKMELAAAASWMMAHDRSVFKRQRRQQRQWRCWWWCCWPENVLTSRPTATSRSSRAIHSRSSLTWPAVLSPVSIIIENCVSSA